MNDAIVAEEVADKIAEGEEVKQKTTVQQFLNELIAMNVHIIELTLRRYNIACNKLFFAFRVKYPFPLKLNR